MCIAPLGMRVGTSAMDMKYFAPFSSPRQSTDHIQGYLLLSVKKCSFGPEIEGEVQPWCRCIIDRELIVRRALAFAKFLCIDGALRLALAW
jgi:hypothetical protein